MIQRHEIMSHILEKLDKLGSFWLPSRKMAAQEARAQIGIAQGQAELQQIAFRISETAAVGRELELYEAQETGELILAERDEAKARCLQLQDEQTKAVQRIGKLEALLSEQRRNLESCHQTIAMLQKGVEQWAADQANPPGDLEQIARQLTLKQKFDLVRNALSLSAPASRGLKAFAQLIQEDYPRFAVQQSSLAGESCALLEFQSIYRELELIVNFPCVRNKTVLAVAGGFGSGKSRFINSFITGGEVTLAVGRNPVAVVPCYVICGEQPEVRGHALNGGALEFRPEFYSSLSHEYLENFGFDLHQIMPFISVQVPMQAELFENLCLIETPGYNPGRGKTNSTDRDLAQESVGQAAAMIWVIDLGADDAISQADLDFIARSGLSGQSLYILLSQIDVRDSSIEEVKEQLDLMLEVMGKVGLMLEINGIDIAGICTYSSSKRKVYATRGQTLEEFLRHHNRARDIESELKAKIDGIFERHHQSIGKDLERQKALQGKVAQFKLKTLEVEDSELHRTMAELCDAIESGLDISALSSRASECEELRKHFKSAICATLDEMPVPVPLSS